MDRAADCVLDLSRHLVQGLHDVVQMLVVHWRTGVVMPETAPAIKIEGVRRWGAEVQFAGTTTLHRQAHAEAVAARRRLVIVPFDDLRIIERQGTAGLEILAQASDDRTATRVDRWLRLT